MVNRFPHGGYKNKILRVDLTSGQMCDIQLDPEMLQQYVGGTGLGARLLYDETAPGTDPFDSRNAVVIMTGPLTGTLVPGSGTYAVVARNALTGLTAAAHANGFFGARLKFAGYDGIIITGQSDRLVFLVISDGSATLHDAVKLAGKGTFATDRFLRKAYGEELLDNSVSVVSIGPAGENMVRFACLMSDQGHIASTGGIGALLGAKKLKAIVVSGRQGIPVGPNRNRTFLETCSRWRAEARVTGLGKMLDDNGTIGLFTGYYKKGWVPIKNLTTNVFPDADNFTTEHIRNKLQKSVPRSCFSCTLNHCQTVQIQQGPYKGVVGEEVEYEILAGFGPNWGIGDPGAATMLNKLNDDLGMDAKEATFLVSMLMEGNEKGYITSKDLDGLDVKWGDPETAAELLRRISRRDGIGDLLAEGVMRSSKKLGGEFPNFAVYVKNGNAPHVHDPRTRWGTLFSQIVSDMGSIEGLDLSAKGAPELGLEGATVDPDEYVGKVNAKTECWRQFQECLTYCYFQTASPKTMLDALNVLTGSSITMDDALLIGKRVVNLLRMLSLREGLTKDGDNFSPRLRTPPTDGPGKGKGLAQNFERILEAYYYTSGWDEKGIPRSDLLRKLDLNFTLENGKK